MDALHYVNAPAHGSEMFAQLRGEMDSLWKIRSDDPLLFAYQLRDALPRIAGLILAVEKWSYAVIECNDPDLPDKGAR
jgi:hypothetical protein